jgi:hypothetical protein
MSSCFVCKCRIHNYSRAILCDICGHWIHLKCTNFSPNDYKTISNDNNPWYCASCLTEIFPFNHYHDNNDFLYAIDYSLQSRLDLNNVNNMSFNPFIDDLDTCSLLNKPDLDLNSSIFASNSQTLSKCIYYTTVEFNDNLTKKNHNYFSTIHINIRSLKKNFNDFMVFMSSPDCSISVIGLSET